MAVYYQYGRVKKRMTQHQIAGVVLQWYGIRKKRMYRTFFGMPKKSYVQHRFCKIIRLVRMFSYGVRFIRRKRTFLVFVRRTIS